MTDLGDGRQLLADALAEPFCEDPDPDHPINRWLNFLSGSFPLWTLQTEEFMRRQETELPATGPLATIIESVLRDEGWDRHGCLVPGPDNYVLLENLYGRREELGKSRRGVFHSALLHEHSDGLRPVMLTHPPSLWWLAEPPEIVEWDDEGPMGSHTVYEEIGREVVGRVQDFVSAKSTEERDAAREALDSYLEDLGANLPAYRPSGDPPEALLNEFFEQGRSLLDLLWTPLKVDLTDETRELFESLNVQEHEVSDWAVRLAIPALSWAEITALAVEHTEASSWTKTGPRPTPRRLTIWMLSHRLGSPPERLANKLGAGSDWDYFKYGKNPIDAYVPEHE